MTDSPAPAGSSGDQGPEDLRSDTTKKKSAGESYREEYSLCESLSQSRSERHSCCVEPSLANIDNSVLARLVCGPGLARPADHNSQCNSLHTALLATHC